MSVSEKMTAIADAIREKTGGTEKIGLDGIAEGVNEVHDVGIEEGKQAQYDEFWDSFQANGSRAFGNLFYGSAWNDITFKPKHSMRSASAANSMFQNSTITDLQGILDRQSVTFDFSRCGSFANFLQNSTISHIGVVSTIGSSGLSNIFYLAKSLETVDLLILKSDGSQGFSSGAFQDCIALANIAIEGVIGQNIDIHWSPLTKDSITSIVNALSTTATGKTLTFKKSAVEAVFSDDEWAALVAEKSNWTISLV